MVSYWVICNPETGFYLPAPKGRGGRGGTHVEALPASMLQIHPPRLFHLEQAAKAALTYWLNGIITVTVLGRLGSFDEVYDESWCVEKVPGREALGLKVCEATLVIPKGLK